MSRDPDPTIAIHFPWDDGGYAFCLNCNMRVSNVYAKRHALVDRDTDGCGIEFKFVATAAADSEWIEYVQRERDDLTYRAVRWAT